jgi:hypothetical protein
MPYIMYKMFNKNNDPAASNAQSLYRRRVLGDGA